VPYEKVLLEGADITPDEGFGASCPALHKNRKGDPHEARAYSESRSGKSHLGEEKKGCLSTM